LEKQKQLEEIRIKEEEKRKRKKQEHEDEKMAINLMNQQEKEEFYKKKREKEGMLELQKECKYNKIKKILKKLCVTKNLMKNSYYKLEF